MEILLVFLAIALFFLGGIGLLVSFENATRTRPFEPSPSGNNGETGYWINANAFFAQADDGENIWRMHTDGSLTVYKTEHKNSPYKYEVSQSRTIHCDVPRDSIFFAAEKYLWLGNPRLGRYEKFIKEHRVWVCMDKHNFDAALKVHNEQRS